MTKKYLLFWGLCGFFTLIAFLPEESKQVKQNSASVEDSSELQNAIASSDDYGVHKEVFLQAAVSLINDGTCSIGDFAEMGGWIRSPNRLKNEPYYFTYCGAMHLDNRYYVDANTGRTFQER